METTPRQPINYQVLLSNCRVAFSCLENYMYISSNCYYNDYVIAVFCSVAGVIILSLIVTILTLALKGRRKKPAASGQSA